MQATNYLALNRHDMIDDHPVSLFPHTAASCVDGPYLFRVYPFRRGPLELPVVED